MNEIVLRCKNMHLSVDVAFEGGTFRFQHAEVALRAKCGEAMGRFKRETWTVIAESVHPEDFRSSKWLDRERSPEHVSECTLPCTCKLSRARSAVQMRSVVGLDAVCPSVYSLRCSPQEILLVHFVSIAEGQFYEPVQDGSR